MEIIIHRILIHNILVLSLILSVNFIATMAEATRMKDLTAKLDTMLAVMDQREERLLAVWINAMSVLNFWNNL